MGFLTPFFLIVFVIILIPNIYAAENNHIVDFRNDNVLVYHKYFDQMDTSELAESGQYRMTFTQNNTERLIVKFPNNMSLPLVIGPLQLSMKNHAIPKRNVVVARNLRFLGLGGYPEPRGTHFHLPVVSHRGMITPNDIAI